MPHPKQNNNNNNRSMSPIPGMFPFSRNAWWMVTSCIGKNKVRSGDFIMWEGELPELSSHHRPTDHKSRGGCGTYTTPCDATTCSLPPRLEPLRWSQKQVRACGIPTMLKQLFPFTTLWQPVRCFCCINMMWLDTDCYHNRPGVREARWRADVTQPAPFVSQEPRGVGVVKLCVTMNNWSHSPPRDCKVCTLNCLHGFKNNRVWGVSNGKRLFLCSSVLIRGYIAHALF